MRKMALFAATIAALGTGGAYADFGTKTVTIKGGVFFPPVMLASQGESIKFVNEDETTHDATASDGSWTTGPISPNGEVTMVIAEGMTCYESSFNDELKGAFGSMETGEAPECFELSGDGENSN